MAKPAPGMGRGLSAILSVSGEHGADDEGLRELPVASILPNPRQPRRRFDEEALQALAASLGERGVLQPVIVRPRGGDLFELVAGERRLRAAQLAGLETIPALVGDHGDAESLELALIENMARENLSPIEEARACAALVEELGLTREDVGRRVGRSRVAVSNLLRLLDLPDDAIELLQLGSLSEGHGRALLLAEDHADRRALAKAAAAGAWSVRTTEQRARASNTAGPGRTRIARRRSGEGELHPDQLAAADELAHSLAAALGIEVEVRAHADGRFTAELSFASREDAADLAQRLGQAPARA